MQSLLEKLEPFVTRLQTAITEISTEKEHEEFVIKFGKDFFAENLPHRTVEIGEPNDSQDPKESFAANLQKLGREISDVFELCERTHNEQIR